MNEIPCRVDAHQHFWRYAPGEFDWMGEGMSALRRDFLPPDLRMLLDRQGIGASVAVQARASEEETDFLIGLAEENPWILGVIGWIDLRADDLEERLERRGGTPVLKGYRHQVEDEPSPRSFLEDGRFNRGVDAVLRRGKVYEVLVRSADLDAVAGFCARHDQGRLVLDHLGKPDVLREDLTTWDKRLKPLAEQEHVVCKLSGLVTEARWGAWRPEELLPYFAVALERFGPDRLLFGSDWPVCLLSGDYARVCALAEAATASLSGPEREAVWGGTARRVYGLGNDR